MSQNKGIDISANYPDSDDLVSDRNSPSSLLKQSQGKSNNIP